MATITLTVVGGVVGNLILPGAGAYVGASIGAAAGSYIDSNYLYPALFPPPTTRIGRIKDFPLQQFSEGAGANYCYGPLNRVDGVVIWLSPILERKRDSGKGGPGDKIARYKYYFDVAIAVADRPTNPITKIQKIFADGKIIFNDAPQITVASSSLSIKVLEIVRIAGTSRAGKTYEVVDKFIDISCLKSVFDLTKFKAGRKLIISGSPTNNTDADGRKIRNVRDNGDGTATLRLAANTNSKTEAAGNPSLTLLQNFEKFDTSRFDAVNFYTGTFTQNPDPIIETYEGAGNVPAYRGTAYVMIQNLSIEYYGNRLPQFEFEVNSSPTESVGSAVSDILLRAGLKAEEFDVSALTGTLVTGYDFSAPLNARNALDPLLLSEDVFGRESSSKLQFFKRETTSKLAITTSDLAASEENADKNVGRPIDVNDIDIAKLPSEIVVSYIDTDKDLQKGSQNDNRQRPVRKNIRVIELPVAMTASKAKDIATRILWRTLRNAQVVKVLLPPSYCVVEEGDIITFTAFGQTYDAIVSEVTFGRNGVIEIDAAIDDIIGVNPSAVDLPGARVVNVDVKNPTEVGFVRADIAALRDAEFGVPGYYVGINNADTLSTWKGAAIYTSTDGADFKLAATLDLPATIGESVVTDSQIEVIVDNETTPGATSIGNWLLRTDGDEPYGGSHRTSSNVGDVFHWDFSLAAGTYDVFARWTSGASRSSKAKYSVQYTGNTAEVRVNQGDPFFFDQWVKLGQWAFSGSHRITLTGQDDGTVCADAVRLFAVTLTNKLGDGAPGYWDLKNSVTVRVTSGSLESRSIEEVLSGGNVALLGNEVLGFRTATLVATNTYTLSKLLRGLRGTEDATAGHKPGESFMLLDSSVRYVQINSGDINKKVFLKIVSAGNVVDDAEVFSYRSSAATVLPLPVARLRVQALLSDDSLQLDWFYRSGKIIRAFESGRQYIQDLSGFEIDVLNSSGEIRRTIAPWLFTSWGGGQDGFYYSSTEQIADGFSAGQTITFRVYQTSILYGRGIAATVSATSTI